MLTFKDPNHNLWYQKEGDYVRIGLYTIGHEYMEVHGYLPCEFPKLEQVLHQGEHFFTFVVNGPYDPPAYAPFDMKIISQNPKNANYHTDATEANTKNFLGRYSFSPANFYKESWLFLVIPLAPEKLMDYLSGLSTAEKF